jgi:hypothetical protein
MCHHQNAATAGQANGQEPRLEAGIVHVGKCGRERVVQHSRGFVEIDPMLLEVGNGFPWIPFENHNASIRSCRERLSRLPNGRPLQPGQPAHPYPGKGTAGTAINRELIAKAAAIDSPPRVVLDMDSTEIPVYGRQEQSATTDTSSPPAYRDQNVEPAGLRSLQETPVFQSCQVCEAGRLAVVAGKQ